MTNFWWRIKHFCTYVRAYWKMEHGTVTLRDGKLEIEGLYLSGASVDSTGHVFKNCTFRGNSGAALTLRGER